MRLLVERLIAEEQHQVVSQCLMQFLDLTVAERLRQRDAFDIGADSRRDRRDIDGLIAHGMILSSATSDVRPPAACSHYARTTFAVVCSSTSQA